MPAQRYFIPFPKIAHYLLNLNHHRGGSKAKFFIKRGFDPANPQLLADALFQHAVDHWPGIMTPRSYGQVFEIVAPMPCPDGAIPRIVSIWKVETGNSEATLVTAYPY